MAVRVSTHVCGQGADQDSAHEGVLTGFTYGVVYDGHGDHDCILRLNALHERDAHGLHSGTALALLNDPHPAQRIFEYATSAKGGAMMNLACVRSDCIENYNVGDSQSWIYAIDDMGYIELVHESRAHSVGNILPGDHKRLDALAGGFSFYEKRDRKIKLLDDDTFAIESDNQVYCDFGGGLRLATTQALGHGGATGCEPDAARITRTRHTKHVCILVSDGVTQVLTRARIAQLYDIHRDNLTAVHVVNLAVRQWHKIWRVIDRNNEGHTSKTRFSASNLDDVSAVVMHVPPLVI